MNHPNPIVLRNETPDDRAEYYNKEAAQQRQEQLEKDKAAFFARGGKITELKPYGELGPTKSPQSIYGKEYKV